MGGANLAPSTDKGARRALDAVINLVPFIDLLSCCISFLLITAVWSQVSSIEVAPEPGGAIREQPDTPPRMTLFVDAGGYLLSSAAGATQAIPRVAGRLDRAGLALRLREVRAATPDVPGLDIRAADAVAYEDVVATMDTALGERFAGLTVNGTADR